MKYCIRFSFFSFFLAFSLDCFSETCSYVLPPKLVKIDQDVEFNLSVTVEKGSCNTAIVSLRMHRADKLPHKQLYVLDNTLGSFFGSRAANINEAAAKTLIDGLIKDVSEPKLAGDFGSDVKCFPSIPGSYLEKLRKNKRNMLSYRWRSSEVRYLAYIEEIEQIVVIAQCSKK